MIQCQYVELLTLTHSGEWRGLLGSTCSFYPETTATKYTVPKPRPLSHWSCLIVNSSEKNLALIAAILQYLIIYYTIQHGD